MKKPGKKFGRTEKITYLCKVNKLKHIHHEKVISYFSISISWKRCICRNNNRQKTKASKYKWFQLLKALPQTTQNARVKPHIQLEWL